MELDCYSSSICEVEQVVVGAECNTLFRIIQKDRAELDTSDLINF